MIVLIKRFDQKVRAIRFDVRLRRHCNSKKAANLIPSHINQFWRSFFLEKHSNIIFFQKCQILRTKSKKDRKKFRKMFFEKSHVSKNKLFCKTLKIIIQNMKSSEIHQRQLGQDCFLSNIQWPITRKYLTQTKHLMPSNDSTHQNLWPDILSNKMWCHT